MEKDGSALTSSSKRKHGIIISYIYTIAQVVVNLIYVPLLLSCIGQEEYGLYQLVGSIMSYVVSINSILSAGVGRFYSKYRAEGNVRQMENTLAIARRLYWILSAVAFAVVCALIPIMMSVYANSFSKEQLIECSIMLITLGINVTVTFNNTVNIAAINAHESFVFLKGTQLLTLVAQPVLIVVLATIYPRALTICLIILLMNMLCAFLQRLYANNVLNAKHIFHGWDRSLIKGLLHFSAAVVMVSIADQVFWNSGKLVVGYYYGAGLVAVYAVGAQIYGAYTQAGLCISGVFFQRISELYHKFHNYEEISSLFARVGRITFLICSMILGGFAILGQDFIDIWAGAEYSEAYLVALIVMIPLTVDLTQNLGLTIMQVENCYQFRGYIYLGLSAVNVLATVLFAQQIGLIGIASLSAICMAVGNGFVMNWYYAKYVHLDILLFWRELIKLIIPFASVLVISAVSYYLIHPLFAGLFRLLAGGLVYLFIYAFIMVRYGLNSYERGSLDKMLGKVKSLIIK